MVAVCVVFLLFFRLPMAILCWASVVRGLEPICKKLVKTQITSFHLTFSDDSTFKDILRFICDEELLRVKAIVWNILPNVRKDALLTKQARLINLFKPKDIWHNVVIVCKQSRNPEDDAQVIVTLNET